MICQKKPIVGDGGAERFALRREPDGVYRVDGRVVPIADDTTLGVDDRQAVVGVQRGSNMGVGRFGVMGRVDVEK